VFVGGAGGATLAFLMLVLCGVSGAAVLDPALGAWGAAITSRAEGLRAARAVASETRLAGVHADRELPALASHAISAPSGLVALANAHARPTDGMTRSGLLGLPPPPPAPALA
jgi:hypothetical protein